MKVLILILFLSTGLLAQSKPQPNRDYDRTQIKYDRTVEKLFKNTYNFQWETVWFMVKPNEFVLFSADRKCWLRYDWNTLSIELKNVLLRK